MENASSSAFSAAHYKNVIPHLNNKPSSAVEDHQVESKDRIETDIEQARSNPELMPALAVLTAKSEPASPSSIKRAITVISRGAIVDANTPAAVAESPTMTPPSTDTTPWPLQQFFAGDIDLDVELSQRFQNMPVLSRISFREMGEKSKRGVATMLNQDGAAQVIIDVDAATHMMQLSFTYGAMLTLRYRMVDLSDMDRQRWVELMRRDQGGLAFLWGASRWEKDYVICVSRRYFTNWYAFSPNGFESAVRVTPDVTKQLLKWLEGYWKPAKQEAETSSSLLTW